MFHVKRLYVPTEVIVPCNLNLYNKSVIGLLLDYLTCVIGWFLYYLTTLSTADIW